MRGYPKDTSNSLSDNRDGDQIVKDAFAKRLYRAIVDKGLTQSEVARRAGLNKAAISSYATARSLPTPTNLNKLAKVLEVAPEELLPPIGDLVNDNPVHIDVASMKAVGDGGLSRLQINKIIPTPMALDILRLVSQDNAKVAN